MIDKLKTLQTLLGKETLVLTGSLALAYHGLTEMDKPKDLDLVLVNPSKEATGILDKLQADYPHPKHFEGSPVNYQFLYEGIKVDVWVTTAHVDKEYLRTKDGILVASVSSIVKAKLSYNRAKDWIQLMQLAKTIYDPINFEKQLPSIRTTNDYDNA